MRGIDDRPVQPHRETKSLGAEDTFAYDLTTGEEMSAELDKIAETVVKRLQRYELQGRTITLKVKYSDFRQITRNRSFSKPVDDLETIALTAKELLLTSGIDDVKIRLLGISLSNFGEIEAKPALSKGGNPDQLKLF